MDEKTSCKRKKKKEEINLEEGTLSVTGECLPYSRRLNLYRGTLLLSCYPPTYQEEIRKVTYKELGDGSGMITVIIKKSARWNVEQLDINSSEALEKFARLEVHLLKFERIIEGRLNSISPTGWR